MADPLEEAVDKFKTEWPGSRILQLSSKSGTFVFKVPSMAEMDAYRARQNNPQQRPKAMESMVRTCLIFPDRDAFQAVVEQKPLLIEKWADKLADAAGADEEVEVKNL